MEKKIVFIPDENGLPVAMIQAPEIGTPKMLKFIKGLFASDEQLPTLIVQGVRESEDDLSKLLHIARDTSNYAVKMAKLREQFGIGVPEDFAFKMILAEAAVLNEIYNCFICGRAVDVNNEVLDARKKVDNVVQYRQKGE